MLTKILLVLIASLFSCNDIFTESLKVYKEGDKLEATIYSSEQPEKLSDYNQFASMVVDNGIAIIKPDSIPKLIKIIHPDSDFAVNLARIDKNGYVWLTAPDYANLVNNRIYVIDPHSETIYKSIKVPKELLGPLTITFGKDKAYFVGIRSGKNIGLGSIDRTNFTVETLAEFDSIGWALPPVGLELYNDKLYYFGSWTSQTDDRKILQFDIEKNQLIKTALYSGYYTYDEDYFYTNGYYVINGNDAVPKLYKLSIDSLTVIREIVFDDKTLICNDNEFIYSVKWREPTMDIYRKSDLEKVKTIDFSNLTKIQGAYFNANFGFISKEIIMLNQSSFYNVKTSEIMNYIFPLNNVNAQNLVLAEGLELKSFEE